MAKSAFQTLVDQDALRVASLSDAELIEVLPILEAARDREAQIFQSLVTTDPAETFSRAMHRKLLGQLVTVSEAARKRLVGAVGADLKTGLVTVGGQTVDSVRKIVDAGIKKFGSGSPLPLDQVSIVASAQRWLAARYARSAKRYAGRFGQSTRQILAAGILRGESNGSIASALAKMSQERLSRLGVKGRALALAQGQHFSSVADAERLVVTESVYAANKIAVDALRSSGGGSGWMKRWNAAHDKRTCKACAAMHGETVPAGEFFSCGLMHPPLHPRCRCSCTPYHQSWGS